MLKMLNLNIIQTHKKGENHDKENWQVVSPSHHEAWPSMNCSTGVIIDLNVTAGHHSQTNASLRDLTLQGVITPYLKG